MSALVCGKRSSSSSSIFEELLHAPLPSSKRPRRSASAVAAASAGGGAPSPAAALRLSPGRPSDRCGGNLAHLRALFPEMDQQFLERALEASGNDLDSTIKSLNNLHLESAETNLSSAFIESGSGISPNIQLVTEDGVNNGGAEAVAENPPAVENLPTDGSGWVELFVSEMMNASNMDDARARASRTLEVLERSIITRAGAEALESFHKENLLLKEHAEAMLRENTVLKRAVAIQHERQKEYDQMNQELQHLKQLVSQYQEQVKTLEINNYALSMHLRQAQQSGSIPGRFHPDVF
ncbi:uncharacterized protein LOC109725183 isoform X2 [Ananas comosus]|uniref:Uncharacterized protein LOC109725183 isoform X2 n=1 Tax=Ananas comosus TaxID=4615 RepID=A0A6P5GPZ7_ANACO|nr:uncharacterized protein LOC109725183 isoform X2 [Ananas comosus]